MPKKLDLKGLRFGCLLVQSIAGKRPNGSIIWNCLCDCGRTTTALAAELKSGHKKSCGCWRKKATAGQIWRRKDLTGKRFGRLLVLSCIGKSKAGNLRWRCICDCGKCTDVDAGNLKKTTSCGCLAREKASQRLRKHGGFKDALFKIWCLMKERCSNPHHKSFYRYGGRNITVCEEWKHDYVAFRDFAISHGWKRGLQINRIDNDKGYSPDNVNFVTGKENMANRSVTLFITCHGAKIAISEFARRFSIPYRFVYDRYKKGLSAELIIKQFNTPIGVSS